MDQVKGGSVSWVLLHIFGIENYIKVKKLSANEIWAKLQKEIAGKKMGYMSPTSISDVFCKYKRTI